MLGKKKKRNGGKKKNHQTCQHAVPALNLFPISSNLWEPGLWSLILFSSVPPTTAPSSVSHFQFHLLPPLCDFHLISLLKFKIYSRFFFFLLDSRWCCVAPVCAPDSELQISSVFMRKHKSEIPWHHLSWICRFKMLTRVFQQAYLCVCARVCVLVCVCPCVCYILSINIFIVPGFAWSSQKATVWLFGVFSGGSVWWRRLR